MTAYGHRLRELPAEAGPCGDGFGHRGRSCFEPARFEALWLVRPGPFHDSEPVATRLCRTHARRFAAEHRLAVPEPRPPRRRGGPPATAAGPDDAARRR